jgi:tRNA1Val (adenine37-N6)-methyltransferase
MANSFFKFKQFVVHQDLAAMKVGTDGVLLGAWASALHVKDILDIGTGTGLIALMLAQRNHAAQIDALEIDANACEQARLNFKQNEWMYRLRVIEDNLQHYSRSASKKYDLLVSNPPFFNNALKNECQKKALARHTDSLSFQDLLHGVKLLLQPNGLFCVVLPADEKEKFIHLAIKEGLFLKNILLVKPTPVKQPKRVLMEFSFHKLEVSEHIMVVEEFGRHGYSEAYKELTKDFYLAF